MEWRDIPGYEGFYQVSDAGDVRSLDREISNGRGVYVQPGQPIAQHTAAKGYRAVGLNRDGRYRRKLVHRLVMSAFVGEDARQVRHRNGNPADNRLPNLRYGTNSENQQDSVDHGTHHMARKTHCLRGHEFDTANTYWYRTPRGGYGRGCRACRRK